MSKLSKGDALLVTFLMTVPLVGNPSLQRGNATVSRIHRNRGAIIDATVMIQKEVAEPADPQKPGSGGLRAALRADPSTTQR